MSARAPGLPVRLTPRPVGVPLAQLASANGTHVHVSAFAVMGAPREMPLSPAEPSPLVPPSPALPPSCPLPEPESRSPMDPPASSPPPDTSVEALLPQATSARGAKRSASLRRFMVTSFPRLWPCRRYGTCGETGSDIALAVDHLLELGLQRVVGLPRRAVTGVAPAERPVAVRAARRTGTSPHDDLGSVRLVREHEPLPVPVAGGVVVPASFDHREDRARGDGPGVGLLHED